MPTATKPKPPALTTVNLTGVALLRPGTWNNDLYTEADLSAIVDAFEAGNAGIDPPVKLGHPPDQKLLNNSGLPAAGYVSALRMDGDTLTADLRDVPERIARLIKSKAYSKVSAEIYFNFSDGEVEHPRLLKAIALLGADVPAVTSLDDVEAWYGRQYAALSAQPAGDVRVYELPAGMSYNALFEAMRAAVTGRYGNQAWVCDIFDDAAIVEIGGTCYRVGFTTDPSGAVSIGADMTPVRRITVWTPTEGGMSTTQSDTAVHAAEYRAAEADQEAEAKRKAKKPASAIGGQSAGNAPDDAKPRNPGAAAVGNLSDSDEEDFVSTLKALLARMDERHKGGKGMPTLRTFGREMAARLESLRKQAAARMAAHSQEEPMNPELLKLLGLADDADDAAVLARVTEMQRSATERQLALDEVRELRNRVGELTAKDAARDAEAAVEAAASSGKLVPALKDWARTYALRDPEGFKGYIDAAPVAVALGGSGATPAHANNTAGSVRTLSAIEQEVADMMGIAPDTVIASKERAATRR